MSALTKLTKSSILLLPAIPIAVYLYMSFGGEDFDAARSHPREEICKQDEDRLAQLQAKPSLDEAVRFGSELRCLKLWPQLQALLDSLSHTAGSTGVSSSNDAAPDDICRRSRTAGLVVAGQWKRRLRHRMTPASTMRIALPNFRRNPPSTRRCVSEAS